MIELYLVEITDFDGTLIGIEKFMELNEATEFIDEYVGYSSFCILYEAKQLDY